MSGRDAAKQHKRILVANVILGSAFSAIREPQISAILASTIIILVLFFEGFPYFLVSLFMCGFQWGTLSSTKWLKNASGIAIYGLPTFVAIAAPKSTCGISSILL